MEGIFCMQKRILFHDNEMPSADEAFIRDHGEARMISLAVILPNGDHHIIVPFSRSLLMKFIPIRYCFTSTSFIKRY